MKKAAIILFLTMCFIAEAAFHSTTYIEPFKSFILGKGTHGSFKAIITSEGPDKINIYTQQLGGIKTLLLVILPRQKEKVNISANTLVEFENANNTKATLVLKLTGDTGLSMGYN